MQLVLPFAVLAFVISSVSAQLPDCATTCILSADTGSCSQTDNTCLCKDQAFITSTTTCIETTCTGSDLNAALQAAQELCAQVGVTLTAPSSTPAGASSTPAASGSDSAGSASSSPTSPVSSASGSSTPASSPSVSAPTTSPTTNAAVSHGVNAIAALGAIAVAAFAL